MTTLELLRDYPRVNNQIKFLDKFLCQKIHNPIVSSILLIILISILHTIQLIKMNNLNQFEFLFIKDYFLDIISNVINLIFIIRFSIKKTKKNENNKLNSNIGFEILLFILQNFGCYKLLFDQNYSLLFTNINIIFKFFVIWQYLCPYIILFMNLIDLLKNWISSSSTSLSSSTNDQFNLLDFLIDANNNFLPIFIAHSYILININFPFLFDSIFNWLIFFYKLCSFSIKFYCIYQFILYELIVVIYNLKFNYINDYSSFYNSINLDEKVSYPNKVMTFYNDYKHWLLIVSSGIVILFDLIYIFIYYSI